MSKFNKLANSFISLKINMHKFDDTRYVAN